MIRRIDLAAILAATAVLGLALGLWSAPQATHAQRDRPQPTPDPRVVAAADRYGTRHVVAALSPPGVGTSTGELRVTNGGWLTTTVAVLELGAASMEPGCESSRQPVVSVTCLEGVGALETRSHRPSADARSLWVYSLDATGAPAACRELTRLSQGTGQHEAWASTHWLADHGEPLAVTWLGVDDAGRVASEGQPATGMAEIAGSIGGPSAAVLPLVARGGQARWVNAERSCLPTVARAGAASQGGATGEGVACPPTSPRRLELAGLGVFDPAALVEAPLSQQEAAVLAVQGRGEILASADTADERGWFSYNAGAPRLPQVQQSATTALPMVITPLANADAKLWVTNQHPTRTAKVSLLMWDGNQATMVPFRDPLALCPGATRSYDIAAIAGEIPATTGGRDNPRNAQPPYLSLRAEAVSEDGTTFAPISVAAVVEGDEGVGAYGGLNLPIMAAAGGLRPNGALRGGPPLVTLVPDVRIAHGPARISTFLAAMTISPDANTERVALVELYDERGLRIAEPLRVRMGGGPGGFLDLARIAGRLGDRFPNGFRGTAMVRGSLDRGAIGVVAMNRPTTADAATDGDHVTVHTGLVIARGPDPAIPTPTPRPTRDIATSTPVSDRRPTPTPEPTPQIGRPILLPYLLREGQG